MQTIYKTEADVYYIEDYAVTVEHNNRLLVVTTNKGNWAMQSDGPIKEFLVGKTPQQIVSTLLTKDMFEIDMEKTSDALMPPGIDDLDYLAAAAELLETLDEYGFSAVWVTSQKDLIEHYRGKELADLIFFTSTPTAKFLQDTVFPAVKYAILATTEGTNRVVN